MTRRPAPAATTEPKGFPPGGADSTGWSVLDADVSFPIAVLLESALRHNGAAMQAFCARTGALLAPHGKTTMAPALFRRQLRDGAWGITAATVWQARTMVAHGVARVLIANEVVTAGDIAWMLDARRRGIDVMCYVDSAAGVELIESTAAGTTGDAAATDTTLPVLVEVGLPGGRAGARSSATALEVAEAVANSRHLHLVGVAGFEGILPAGGDGDGAAEVVAFLQRIVEIAEAVDARSWFAPDTDVLLSAGGSAYFDHVVEVLGRARLGRPARVVVRPGCYIVHDDGALHDLSPMGAAPRLPGGARLRAAVEVWGAVLSRPEPTRMIIGIGKRDISADGILPVLKKRATGDGRVVDATGTARTVAINDQHLYLDVDAAARFDVGDLLGFGISHPCTTFDKWRALPIVDDDYRVLEIATTCF